MRRSLPTTIPGEDGPIDVEVRELLAEEARDFDTASMRNSPNALGMLLQLSIANPESHELLFEPTDRGALQTLPVAGLKGVLDLIKELSGISDEDIDKAKRLLSNGQPTEPI